MAAYLSSNTDPGQEPKGNKSFKHPRNTPTASVGSRAEGGKDDYEKGEGQLCTGMVGKAGSALMMTLAAIIPNLRP
jgi:hypothetical protein